MQSKLGAIKLKPSQVKFLSWLIDGGTGADADVLTRWVKKAKIVIGNVFDSEFYTLVQETDINS